MVRSGSGSALVDVEVMMIAETDKAILISDTDDEEDAHKIWLPKSQVEFTPPTIHGTTTVTLPEWLAHKKGLI